MLLKDRLSDTAVIECFVDLRLSVMQKRKTLFHWFSDFKINAFSPYLKSVQLTGAGQLLAGLLAI